MNYDRNRKVGKAASQWYLRAIDDGFFDKYMSGAKGIDFGGTGYSKGTGSILPTAEIVDIGYPGYDGVYLPFKDEELDYVFSSHCLEHIPNNQIKTVWQELYRVVKTGSHLVITVPHLYLYEKKWKLPSRWNGGHKRFYTPGRLLTEIEASLLPNSYRVEVLQENYDGWKPEIPPIQHSHRDGSFEILVVLKKVEPPPWKIE